MTRVAYPSRQLLDSLRAHRAVMPAFTNLYPYVVGRITGVLDDPLSKPAAKVAEIRTMIMALDIVEAEPKPAVDPRPYRSACPCPCHTRRGMMHVRACCIPDPQETGK